MAVSLPGGDYAIRHMAKTPEVGDYVKNQWEQRGTVTRVHFAQDEEDLICIRWDDEGLKLLFSSASEYTLVSRKVCDLGRY